MGQGRTYKLPYKSWRVWTDEQLRTEKANGRGDEVEKWMYWYRQYEQNKLSFFLPHGIPWHKEPMVIGNGLFTIPPSTYPERYGNDGVAFLNDWESDISMVLASSKTGKSYHGAAWQAFRIIPCSPDWICFKEHGIEYHPWNGPKLATIYSYAWDNVGDLWKRYRDLLPREELQEYAPNWGKYPGETGRAKEVTAGRRAALTVPLKCGSTITFLAYSQSDVHTESYESDIGQFDEQPDKKTWHGFTRASQTRGDYTPACFTFTGRIMENRPDTGGNGWVIQELWKGQDAKGRKISRYRFNIPSTPDAIISAKKKQAAYTQWADPNVLRTDADKRAGLARYWGDVEYAAGCVFSDFQDDIHLVEPFTIPSSWSRYRLTDHGEAPCAALWIAMSPKGDAFAYREYYLSGNVIAQNAANIVELSGNTRHKLEQASGNGMTWDTYEEIFSKEFYLASVLDIRSFSSKTQMGISVGQFYNQCGLYCSPSSGKHTHDILPLAIQWMGIDPQRPHYVTQKPGAPRLYIFNTLRNFISEIKGYIRDPTKPDKIIYKNDHLISCLLFWVALNPVHSNYTEAEDSCYQTHSSSRQTKNKQLSYSGYYARGTVLDR